MATLETQLAALEKSVGAAGDGDGAKQQLAAGLASINRLMMTLDEIDLSEVGDEERAAARARRKQAAATLEKLMANAQALQRKVHAVGGQSASRQATTATTTPASAPKQQPPTQSAEIDGDED